MHPPLGREKRKATKLQRGKGPRGRGRWAVGRGREAGGPGSVKPYSAMKMEADKASLVEIKLDGAKRMKEMARRQPCPRWVTHCQEDEPAPQPQAKAGA